MGDIMTLKAVNMKNNFVRYCGIEMQESTDFGHSQITIMPEHLNLYGIVHGGLLYTMADAAAGAAARNIMEQPVTLNSDFHFIKCASRGKLKAKADIIHAGNHITRVAVNIETEDEKLLAKGIFTYYSSNRQETGNRNCGGGDRKPVAALYNPSEKE